MAILRGKHYIYVPGGWRSQREIFQGMVHYSTGFFCYTIDMHFTPLSLSLYWADNLGY